MSKPISIRTLVFRVLYTMLGWVAVMVTLSTASAASGSPLDAFPMIAAAAAATGLLFVAALCTPLVRRITEVQVGKAEISASWWAYPKEIIGLAWFSGVANFLILLAVHWIGDGSTLSRFTDLLPIASVLLGAVLCYVMAVPVIRSMRRTTVRDGRHRPVLGVVYGISLPGGVSLAPQVIVPAVSHMTWQLFILCAIAGATTLFAALITLRAAPAAKN